MSPALRKSIGIAVPLAVLGLLVWRLGAGPFLDGVRSVDAGALVAAAAIGVATTVCCAWRWVTVARGLGIELPMPAAIAAYYRSLFLNTTLPGGVVGDVHRGISHGRDISDLSRALRSVAWERTAGQVVQAVMTLVVLLVLPSPVRFAMPYAVAAVLLGALAVGLVARMRPSGGSLWARIRRAIAGDLRDALLARRAWAGVVVASALVVAGHAITFIIAARAAGTTAPLSRLVPIAFIAMLGMVLPSVGGWGPREGVTAWVFGAAGLGAQQGVTTAVVYGVLVFVACLPGAAVLAVAWLRSKRVAPAPRRRPAADRQQIRKRPVHA